MVETGTTSVPQQDIMDVVRLLPDVLFRCYKGDDGRIYWSLNEGGLAEEFGLTTEQIKGKSLEDLFPGGASDELKEHFEAAFRGERTVFTNEMGGRHFRHFPQPVIDEDGNVVEVVGFIADVTALVEAEQALTESNKELEAFVHTVSHDLANPLTAMTNLLALLRRQVEGQPRSTVERMERIARSMADTLKGLLWLSQAQQRQPAVQRVDLSGMALEVAGVLAARDPDRDVDVDVEDGLMSDADPELARVLLENLIGNAWKFTGDTQDARIQVRREEDGFAVEDNGPGFPEAEAEALFEPFHRATAAAPGSGIGLATAQRIVAAHGGVIRAENAYPGARFFFTLVPRIDDLDDVNG